jgi:hypothetical protein
MRSERLQNNPPMSFFPDRWRAAELLRRAGRWEVFWIAQWLAMLAFPVTWMWLFNWASVDTRSAWSPVIAAAWRWTQTGVWVAAIVPAAVEISLFLRLGAMRQDSRWRRTATIIQRCITVTLVCNLIIVADYHLAFISRMAGEVGNWLFRVFYVGFWMVPFVAFAVWHLQLARICQRIGEAYDVPRLRDRFRQTVRNWWIVLAECVFLPIIDLVSRRSGRNIIVAVLYPMLLAFIVYATIDLLISLRAAARAVRG